MIIYSDLWSMKNLGNINVVRDQIEASRGKAPKLIHKRKGAIIKMFYAEDVDKYFVEDVVYQENEYNIIYDEKTIFENQSGNPHLEVLIESNKPFKQACEELRAEWYACVNGVHYACLLK